MAQDDASLGGRDQSVKGDVATVSERRAPLAPEGASGIVAGAHSTSSRASAMAPRGVRRVRAERSASMERWNVGILIFDEVEVLDFAGPFEVFSRTRLAPGPESRRSEASAPFHAFTVSKTTAPVSTTGDLRVVPHHGFAGAPRIDLLLVPGGI